MKLESLKLERQRLVENVEILTGRIGRLAGQLQRDIAVDEYFNQFGFDKREVVDNFDRYAKHLDGIIGITGSSNKVNINVYGQLVTHLLIWLSQNKIYSGQHTPIQTAAAIFELDSKMMCFQQFSQSALFFKDDITSSPRLIHPQHDKVYEKIEYINNEDPEATRNQYSHMKTLMTITNAAVLTEINQSNMVLAVLAFGFSYPRFLIDSKQAQLRNKAFLRQPNLISLQRIWNLPENGIISKLKYVQYEGIKTNQELYIPRDYTQKVDIFSPSDNSVKIRILSHEKIHFWQKYKECCSNCCVWDEVIEPINTVILHAHGGGFVALSSSTMQSYTRRWANQLKVPVLSIDYGKPPLHTFPQPVYDVLRVYRFVTEELNKYCNISPVNIILTGDSAGGNLICSLMGLILKLKLKMPQGIFLAYPACDLRKIYSPSRIHSFSDAILHPPLLLLCLKEYLGNNSSAKESDPLATPLLLTEEYVNANKGDYRFPLKWPKTRIIVGEMDPLLDDSLRLCEKLCYSGIDYQCKIFKDLGHGFLSIQKMISQGERGIVKSIELLRELLS